jgi:hypothetical protein
MILNSNEANTLPIIEYDELKGEVKISGRSVSVEVNDYFEKFLEYFENYIFKNPTDLNITFEFEYFNTQTVRMIIKFLKNAKKVEESNYKVSVRWIVEEDDEDMIDAGIDFEGVVGIDFNFIYKKSKN